MAIKTITLKGTGMRKELLAGGAITPGHLVERSSTAGDVVVHSTAGGNAIAAFAVENDIAGDEITVAYANNETVQYDVFSPGDEVYALLQGAGTAVIIGSFLESAGDGTLRLHVAPDLEVSGAAPDLQVKPIVAIALEALDISASGTADGRIQVEIV